MRVYAFFTMALGLFCIISCTSKVDNYTLSSPDGKLVLSVEQDSTGVWGYSFTGNGDKLINLSHLGYENEEKGMIPSADWSVFSWETSHDGIWKPVWGKREQVKDQYNELTLSFAAPKEESGLDGKIGVCCHSGLAERNAEYHDNFIFYRD